jgi:hypothetical protein
MKPRAQMWLSWSLDDSSQWESIVGRPQSLKALLVYLKTGGQSAEGSFDFGIAERQALGLGMLLRDIDHIGSAHTSTHEVNSNLDTVQTQVLDGCNLPLNTLRTLSGHMGTNFSQENNNVRSKSGRIVKPSSKSTGYVIPS